MGWYRFTGIAGFKRYVQSRVYDAWVRDGRTGYTKWYEPYPCVCEKCGEPMKVVQEGIG